MPSLTRRLQGTTTPTRLFGIAKDRTSWTIYNTNTSVGLWWSTSRLPSYTGTPQSGFFIPPNTAFTLKVPEDDPSQEVWIVCAGSILLYIYEGFGGVQ